MYDSYIHFFQAYQPVRRYYENLTRNIAWLGEPVLQRAWDIYQQAREQPLKVLVMGRTCVDEPGRQPQQFGNAITAADHQGLGVITDSADTRAIMNGRAGIANMQVATKGMIMHFYNSLHRGYHFLYNDAWLLGGAHGRCEFNLASPRWRRNIWDQRGRRLTATGREAVFLDSCGYQVIPVGNAVTLNDPVSGGAYTHRAVVLVPANPQNAANASFQSLVNAIQGAQQFHHVTHLCVAGSP